MDSTGNFGRPSNVSLVLINPPKQVVKQKRREAGEMLRAHGTPRHYEGARGGEPMDSKENRLPNAVAVAAKS